MCLGNSNVVLSGPRNMEESSPDVLYFNRKPSNATKVEIDQSTGSDQVRERDLVSISGLDKDDFYDMSGEKYMYIFNHYTYERSLHFQHHHPSDRVGTDRDVAVLKEVFGKLKFKVLVYNDYRYNQIQQTVTSIIKQDHINTSCVCLVFLTHGDRGGVLYAADRPYLFTNEVTKRFESPSAHPGLVGIPKLFIVQACRGGSFDDGKRMAHDGSDGDDVLLPTHADFLILYSTVEDFVSWRDVRGSWLIQELCELLKEHGRKLDLLHIITMTNGRVAREYCSNTRLKKTNNKKQMPQTNFTLTKRVLF